VEIKISMAAGLAALGIIAPWPDFIGGLLLCLAGAYAAMILSPPGQQSSLWTTIFVALVIGLIIAIAHGAIQMLGRWPLQLAMGCGGVLSRPAMLAFASFGRGLEKRAGELPAKAKLPWED